MADSEISWIATNILPFEPDIRRWLRRSSFGGAEEDDIVQEAYSRIARAKSDRIVNGRAYFFQVVKNLLIEHLRRERIVRFEAMAEVEELFILDNEVPIDRLLIDREELSLVMRLVATLPDRCREVITLRRIEGLSQRETAERLRVSENVVEKQSAIGLELLSQALSAQADQHGYMPRERRARVRRNSRRN